MFLRDSQLASGWIVMGEVAMNFVYCIPYKSKIEQPDTCNTMA